MSQVLLALASVVCLLLFFNDRGESIVVLPHDIMIVDRDVHRISDNKIKWYVTVINSAKGKAEVSFELEIYNARSDVVHRA